jgi:8-oxo-dGTP pyrophosphatase MutT (NUDIX family)
MDLVNAWTGRTACALQAALRLSNEAFARQLGVAVRTIATWHQRPDLTPRAEMQQLLDTALQQAPASARTRFATMIGTAQAPEPDLVDQSDAGQPMRVAIAITTKDRYVLIVQPRGEDGQGTSWQFPAGVVKPGGRPDVVAVRETLAETGVHCRVVRPLGSRLHPITHVYCDYLLCDYLTGNAENRDPAENVSVTWAPIDHLARFIPLDRIFPPILDALEIPREPDP